MCPGVAGTRVGARRRSEDREVQADRQPGGPARGRATRGSSRLVLVARESLQGNVGAFAHALVGIHKQLANRPLYLQVAKHTFDLLTIHLRKLDLWRRVFRILRPFLYLHGHSAKRARRSSANDGRRVGQQVEEATSELLGPLRREFEKSGRTAYGDQVGSDSFSLFFLRARFLRRLG